MSRQFLVCPIKAVTGLKIKKSCYYRNKFKKTMQISKVSVEDYIK